MQKLALVIIAMLLLSVAVPLDSYAQKIKLRPQPTTLDSLQTDLKNLEVKARQVIMNITDTSKQSDEDQKITTMLVEIQNLITVAQNDVIAAQQQAKTVQDMVNMARGGNPAIYKEQQAIQNIQNAMKELDNYLTQIQTPPAPPAPPPPPPPQPTQEQLNAAEIKSVQSTLNSMNTQIQKYISKLTLYDPRVKQANDGLQKLQTELNGIQNMPVDNQTVAIKTIKTKLDPEWSAIRMIDPFNSLGGYFNGFLYK